MTLPAFSRATRSALARLGESALLRGAPALHKVNVERDVQMTDREGNIFLAQFIGMFDVSDAPAKGDVLVLGGETFTLEYRVDSNGYSERYVLRKT